MQEEVVFDSSASSPTTRARYGNYAGQTAAAIIGLVFLAWGMAVTAQDQEDSLSTIILVQVVLGLGALYMAWIAVGFYQQAIGTARLVVAKEEIRVYRMRGASSQVAHRVSFESIGGIEFISNGPTRLLSGMRVRGASGWVMGVGIRPPDEMVGVYKAVSGQWEGKPSIRRGRRAQFRRPDGEFSLSDYWVELPE